MTMSKFLITTCTAWACLVSSPVSAQTLYSNGGTVTNPGAGSNGADVSQSSLAINTGGSTVTPAFRLADDFTVPGPGWNVTGITMQAYITSTAGSYGFPPVSPITSINMNIMNGIPGAGGAVIFSSVTLGANAWTGAYRTFNGVLVNDQRPIMGVQATFPNIFLAPGTYWLDVQMTGVGPSGSTVAFSNYVMAGGVEINGNARQFNGTTWAPLALPGAAPIQGGEFPFSVQGTVAVPEPTTWALIGISISGIVGVMYRRRKVNDLALQQKLKR